MSQKEIRIIITGTPGCGKTTAVQSVNALGFQGSNRVEKRSTTIGQDYAELSLDDEIVLRCYGTPGQRRFAFIWELLARKADGLISFKSIYQHFSNRELIRTSAKYGIDPEPELAGGHGSVPGPGGNTDNAIRYH